MKAPKRILPLIVISQFCCISLWFAGNGVMGDLTTIFQLEESALGHLTSFVQFGFIIGTLCFAILSYADRYPPSKVFFICAILGAIFNIGILWEGNNLTTILSFRFFTGFFLAGIYPVGMKIAADYYDKGLGKSLGFLVGALVLGTAFPHFLKDLTQNISWRFVIIATSCLAIIGGLLMLLFVPKGPFCKPSQKVEISAFVKVFKNKDFRSAAFGYFGHMWELYAFWAFVPIILNTYNSIFPTVELNVSLWSFIIIGIGGISCVLSGYLSQKHGTKTIAFVALLLSCICCLLSPLAFTLNNSHVFIAFLIFWGMVVIADSPLFSTMVAQNAPSENKGTALTIVNCIGFTITIVSIQLITLYSEIVGDTFIYMILAIGPIIGLIKLRQNNTKLT